MLDLQWVSSTLTETGKQNPLISTKILKTTERVIIEQLSQKQLTPSEIKDIATILINETVQQQK